MDTTNQVLTITGESTATLPVSNGPSIDDLIAVDAGGRKLDCIIF